LIICELRGGSLVNTAELARSALRSGYSPGNRNASIPVGISAIRRWLSEATPPVTTTIRIVIDPSGIALFRISDSSDWWLPRILPFFLSSEAISMSTFQTLRSNLNFPVDTRLECLFVFSVIFGVVFKEMKNEKTGDGSLETLGAGERFI
jgi:hypothetical protein